MKSKEKARITLRFPKWLNKEIEEQSAYSGMTKNSFLVMVISDALNKKTKNRVWQQ